MNKHSQHDKKKSRELILLRENGEIAILKSKYQFAISNRNQFLFHEVKKTSARGISSNKKRNRRREEMN